MEARSIWSIPELFVSYNNDNNRSKTDQLYINAMFSFVFMYYFVVKLIHVIFMPEADRVCVMWKPINKRTMVNVAII